MAPWSIAFSSRAKTDLAALDPTTRRRIMDALTWFAEHFEEMTPIPLSGPQKGFFKFRVGDWRVMYMIKAQERLLAVHYIDRRDKIYKRR